MNPVLLATMSLLGLGLLAAIILAIAAKIFYVWEDPKIADIEDALLGANCGGCGFAGCAAAAEAVVKGKAKADVCIAGGFDVAVAVSKVMGVAVTEKESEISVSSCRYGSIKADTNYIYNGIKDCSAAMLLYGGTKECTVGCLGLGTCADMCPFGAIVIGNDSLPVVNADTCTGCGTCTQVCPKSIIHLTSHTKRMISAYTTDECTSPCQQICPTGIDIPKYIQAIADGNPDEAVRVMREKNPLLLICARICPAPCEEACRRNLVDEPVAINMLKKYAADYEMKTQKRVQPFTCKATNKKIAIIGGGVEGLSVAYYLARLGHAPTIFEATAKPGGILRYVITKDRLPDEVLDWEIQGIIDSGVEVKTEQVLGNNITVDTLLQKGYECIVLTTGGVDSTKILLESASGQPVPGLFLSIDFLNLLYSNKQPDVGRNVCIVDGGQAVGHIIEYCQRKGAHVTYITHEDDIDQSLTGYTIEVKTGVSSTAIHGNGTTLNVLEICNEYDESEKIDVDTIILSKGRLPELVIAKEHCKDVADADNWCTIPVYKTFSEKEYRDIFSSADILRMSDYTAVVKAVSSGRRVVRGIHLYLSDEELSPQKDLLDENNAIHRVEYLEHVPMSKRNNVKNVNNSNMRQNRPFISVTDQGFSKETAVKEAERCLNCGLLCYKKTGTE